MVGEHPGPRPHCTRASRAPGGHWVSTKRCNLIEIKLNELIGQRKNPNTSFWGPTLIAANSIASSAFRSHSLVTCLLLALFSKFLHREGRSLGRQGGGVGDAGI